MSLSSDKQVTFVVQGPIYPAGRLSTQRCLLSARQHFPDSRIVLSTWPDSDVTGLVYDQLVISQDPGPIVLERDKLRLPNNLNRQIVATQAGLAEVTTEFSVKLRSDAYVTGRGFLQFFDAFPFRSGKYSLFDQRLIIPREFTRSARSFVPLAYHPSDLFQFGLTTDLKRYWNTDPLKGEALAAFQLPDPPVLWYKMFDSFRYTTEQYLFLAFLQREGHSIDLRDYGDVSGAVPELSEAYIFNNFLPVEAELLGVRHPKFARRAHRSLLNDCSGIREFTSWYVAELAGAVSPAPLGSSAPDLTRRLRLERVAREYLKRIPVLKQLYAKRYLAR
ncbi:hypothetical protein IFT84_14060 [Rhizobium sp. CFBP 8762]|uniref:WavE lipopolysaccharide synthesis family protein n=1 Tax=Rhizobium sp. CFBP 8762 TaxID=2775279 RepID=UPI00177E8A99|nr:WavE lipopolysaccharide synthesis family protein [Rhizobium sp. CFBP 8762]MBD8555632.1 hypothetical protein [Rhizobium sp. CFBP 8762]